MGSTGVAIVGYTATGFILRFSWGTGRASDYHDDGYVIMPFTDFDRLSADPKSGFEVVSVTDGSKDLPDPIKDDKKIEPPAPDPPAPEPPAPDPPQPDPPRPEPPTYHVTSIHRCDEQLVKGVALILLGAVLLAFTKFERSALSVASTAAAVVIIIVGVSMMSCFD
jgi:hypothetical protein